MIISWLLFGWCLIFFVCFASSFSLFLTSISFPNLDKVWIKADTD